jgi:Uma2 family endonuclease
MSIAAATGESGVLGTPLPARTAVPPLENGDRLTRREFMRRYQDTPHTKKAELIEGKVYMAAAVRIPHHGRPHGWLGNIISTYAMQTGIDFADNGTVELDPDNAPQPDYLMFLPSELGGRAVINSEGYLEGPPDFVAEVAASSVSIDLHEKLQAYRRNGVREYLVWRVLDEEVDWFVLSNDQFDLRSADSLGILRSEVFPGLWINVPALLKRRAVALWETLDEGTATPEYAAFAARVAAASQRGP